MERAMSIHTNIDPIDVLLAEHETATARLDAFRSALTRVLAGGSGQAELSAVAYEFIRQSTEPRVP
jgi:hypothetical protein